MAGLKVLFTICILCYMGFKKGACRVPQTKSRKSGESQAIMDQEHTVPSFFQDESEEALVSRVRWSEETLGIPDRFFANILRVDEPTFSRWKSGRGVLDERSQMVLRHFWRVLLHIFSFVGFRYPMARTMLNYHSPPKITPPISEFAPPWAGTSLREYLEDHGSPAIAQVDRWIQGVRFGEPY